MLVTTYESLLLINRKTGKHPVFIGPMLIHQRRTYENYFYFASELLKYRRSLSSINAVGTDGEEQLSKAFNTVFPVQKSFCVQYTNVTTLHQN